MYTGQFTMDIKFNFLFDIFKHPFKYAIVSIRELEINVFLRFMQTKLRKTLSNNPSIQCSLGLCIKCYNFIINIRVITRLTHF